MLDCIENNEYSKLELLNQYINGSINDDSQILFEKYTSYYECNHDIWCYMGAYYTEYDCGPESRDHSYRAFREEDIEYYKYRCLECYGNVEVKKKEHEEFIKQHIIIKPSNKAFFYDRTLHEVREMYFKFLYTNPTDKAYKKLMKRI